MRYEKRESSLDGERATVSVGYVLDNPVGTYYELAIFTGDYKHGEADRLLAHLRGQGDEEHRRLAPLLGTEGGER